MSQGLKNFSKNCASIFPFTVLRHFFDPLPIHFIRIRLKTLTCIFSLRHLGIYHFFKKPLLYPCGALANNTIKLAFISLFNFIILLFNFIIILLFKRKTLNRTLYKPFLAVFSHAHEQVLIRLNI
jgi:hypothetical protein